MTYADKLRDPRWQKKRLEILHRDDFRCVLCTDSTTELQVHHLKYSGDPWDTEDQNLKTLCKHCHLEMTVFAKDLKYNHIAFDNIRIKKYLNDAGGRILFIRAISDDILFITNYDSNGNLIEGTTLQAEVFRDLKDYLNKE